VEAPKTVDLPKNNYVRALLLGAFGGLAIVAVPYLLTLFLIKTGQVGAEDYDQFVPQYGLSLIIILPLLQGFLVSYFWGKPRPYTGKYWRFILPVLLIDYFFAVVLFQEGSICLLMSAPIFMSLIALGIFVGRPFSPSGGGKSFEVAFIPLVMLAVAYETHYSAPSASSAISDAVTINAPPEAVWRYIVQYPENAAAPDYWLWKLGMPAPMQSTASGAFVGADRQCKFTNGIAFEEEITEIIPNKVLTFKVTKQPDHPEIIGHFSLDKGQLILEANADGTTTVIATSWYRIFVRPSFYYDWWATDIVRHVHFRVLGHMKKLSEADQMAKLADPKENAHPTASGSRPIAVR
jgi:uncharacterized protein YndB with AHSA1/START domain